MDLVCGAKAEENKESGPDSRRKPLSNNEPQPNSREHPLSIS